MLVAAVTTLVTLVAADRLAGRLDAGYAPARGAPGTARTLTTPEFSVRIVNNALGFREPRLPAAKPRDTIRVVAVGDSFTQGYGVDESESYPRLLESLLRHRDPAHRYEVINLGVPGTNPIDYLGNLRTVGMRYQPDVVLVGLMANDVQDVRTHMEQNVVFGADVLAAAQNDVARPRPWWKRATNALLPTLYPLAWHALNATAHDASAVRPAAAGSADAARRPAALPPAPLPRDRWPDVLRAYAARLGKPERAETLLHALSPRDAQRLAPLLVREVRLDDPAAFEPTMLLLGLMRPRLFADAVLLPPAYDAAFARTTSLLRAIADTAAAGGARTLVVFIPALQQVSDVGRGFLEEHHFAWDARTLTDTTFSDRLQAFGRQEHVAVLDLLPMLRTAAASDGPPLYFARDGHWTPRGHALAAAAIADALAGPEEPTASPDVRSVAAHR